MRYYSNFSYWSPKRRIHHCFNEIWDPTVLHWRIAFHRLIWWKHFFNRKILDKTPRPFNLYGFKKNRMIYYFIFTHRHI